jgi:hypothetical protein
MKNLSIVAALAVASITLTAAPAVAASDGAASPPTALANTAHLDFLLDTVSPTAIDGHTTYRLAEEPDLTMPWTYADARDGGTFERVGGGPLDPETGYWGQGAYNSDDVARAAVVYLRHWQQTGSAASRDKAYELLRSVAYLQTDSGPNAGNVVLWMQPDGTLNPSPEPVELPDPSDSGASYWLARSLWAFGEGYAAFTKSDPSFAAFLQDRMQLGVGALERQVLGKYGKYLTADGEKVPAWLIVNGADASAEAVLGLSAYVSATQDRSARSALTKLARGIAEMGAGNTREWPYGAIMPWAESPSMWHAWSSQMPAALAEASNVLKDRSLLTPALADSGTFTPTLITAGGPDNAWYPTPIEKVQIAYGADSRLQSLLAVADASGRDGFEELAAIMGAWYFGNNKSGAPVYDPATGVTYDGVQADGTVNKNSGAESTIHGLLSMLALDAHPEVAQRAQSVASVEVQSGLAVVEAETAIGGAVVTPESAWTGESQWSGGAYLSLDAGESATLAAGAGSVEAVIYEPYPGSVTSKWNLGSLRSGVGKPGITEAAGALLPSVLKRQSTGGDVTVTAGKGTLKLDALIVRPTVSRLVLEGSGGRTELVNSASTSVAKVKVGASGERSVARIYSKTGKLVGTEHLRGSGTIRLPAGGFAVITS